jgi:hypothetical protein
MLIVACDLHFDRDPDLDPNSLFDADPDPDPTFHFVANQDPQQFRLHTRRLRKRDNFLTGEGGMVWGRSQVIRRRKSLVIYKSFNPL